MRDYRHRKVPLCHRRHREADPVDADRPFFHDQIQDLIRTCDCDPDCILFPSHRFDLPGSVNVTGNDMTAEPAIRRHGPLQIYITSVPQCSETASPHRLRHHIGGKLIIFHIRDRKADTIDRDAVTDLCSFQDFFRFYRQCTGISAQGKCLHLSEFFYDPCKHALTSFPIFNLLNI